MYRTNEEKVLHLRQVLKKLKREAAFAKKVNAGVFINASTAQGFVRFDPSRLKLLRVRSLVKSFQKDVAGCEYITYDELISALGKRADDLAGEQLLIFLKMNPHLMPRAWWKFNSSEYLWFLRTKQFKGGSAIVSHLWHVHSEEWWIQTECLDKKPQSRYYGVLYPDSIIVFYD